MFLNDTRTNTEGGGGRISSDLVSMHSSSEEMCAVCNLSECLSSFFHFPLANERTKIYRAPNLTII